MPNPTNFNDHPVLPLGTAGQVHGYVGVSASTPPATPLPSQSEPNDLMSLSGSGAPVDGTSGTGAGQAGKGSRYTDYANGNLYINAGTKASPTWKLVTRAP